MGVFAYKGRNERGDLVEGKLEGNDSGSIADQLMKSGITPIQIKQSSGLSGGKMSDPEWFKRLFAQKATPMDLLLFTRQMYTLLKAGVPIMRALAGLQESSQSPGFIAVLKDLRESLDSGRELNTAMRRHPKIFSTFYVSMVQVGEMTGMLDETFDRLFGFLEFERDMSERIKAALRYPGFVILAMTIALVVINVFVIPSFAKVFESYRAELPLMTRVLIAFSKFTMDYWMLMLAGVVAAVAAFRTYTSTPVGHYQWDKYKFKLPIAGKIIYKSTLARFARAMGLSFKSGMPILQGLKVVSMVVDNEFMRTRIALMGEGVERGESILHTAVATDVFNPVVLQMIAVGEETGDMDGLMFEVADMYQRDVEYEVKNLSAQIEPILIMFLGVLVLILALGVFLPMWDLGKVALHR